MFIEAYWEPKQGEYRSHGLLCQIHNRNGLKLDFPCTASRNRQRISNLPPILTFFRFAYITFFLPFLLSNLSPSLMHIWWIPVMSIGTTLKELSLISALVLAVMLNSSSHFSLSWHHFTFHHGRRIKLENKVIYTQAL